MKIFPRSLSSALKRLLSAERRKEIDWMDVFIPYEGKSYFSSFAFVAVAAAFVMCEKKRGCMSAVFRSHHILRSLLPTEAGERAGEALEEGGAARMSKLRRKYTGWAHEMFPEMQLILHQKLKTSSWRHL